MVKVRVRDNGETLQSPAIGPAWGDINNPTRNFVYASTFASNDQYELRGVLGDMNATSHSAHIDLCPGEQVFRQGSYGSPGVLDFTGVTSPHATVVVASDDTGIYAFDNTFIPGNDPHLVERDHACYQQIPGFNSFSGTGVIFPNRNAVWIHEQGRIIMHHVPESGDFVQWWQGSVDVQKPAWEWTHMAGDAFGRFFVPTPGSGQFEHERRVLAYKHPTNSEPGSFIDQDWNITAFTPPGVVCGNYIPTLFEQFEAPPAIDEDGTIIVCNRGYVMALRPLLGDLNGDGCRNNYDIFPFLMALNLPFNWESTYGAPLGINLLGVGDADNDGDFDADDVDPFVDLIVYWPGCSPGYGTPPLMACPYDDGPAGPAGGASDGAEEPAGWNDPAYWPEFWTIVEQIRAQRDGSGQ
ncbi:MAG: hypothetical protein JNG88_14350 [Phycisphaerales bacterium]|nr:hypothetical protein [Phycisphaerales bacterium]